MKKLLFSLICLTQGILFSLPMSNPWEASLFCDGPGILCCEGNSFPFVNSDAFKLRFGFLGDYVFDRHLRVNSVGSHGGVNNNGGNIQTVRMMSNSGLINLNVCNRLDLFATLGATEISAKSPARCFSPLGEAPDFTNTTEVNFPILLDAATSFSLGAGLRGTIWRCGNLAIGGEAQYFHTNPSLVSLNSTSFSIVNYLDDFKLNYHEWQLGMGTSYQVCLSECIQVLPYAGVSWSLVRGYFGNPVASMNELTDLDEVSGSQATIFTVRLNNWANARLWGYVVGLTVMGYERLNVGIQGHFGSEKALSVNSTIRF